jgi:hypothetical protein
VATFEAQVEGLTSLSIDGSSAPTQTELTQFLTDAAAEVINAMPSSLKTLCATEDTFTSTAVGSEAETLESAQLIAVTRSDGTIEQPCRRISARLRGRASDSADMNAATATDPVYYIYNGKVNALPASGSCKYLEVNNPAVAYGDSAVSNFPDEYEYLLPLYASVKSLQNAMASKAGNSDITTALGALKQSITNAGTEIGLAKTEAAEIAAYTDTASGSNLETAADGIATAVAKFSGAGTSADPALLGHETVYTTGEGLKKVNDALDTAISYINGDFPASTHDLLLNLADVDAQLDSEDIELAGARMQQASTTMSAIQTSINIAQAHIADWNAAVNALQAEISGFSSEVSSRAALVGTKVQAVQSYTGTANAYLSQASSNAAEIQSRLSVLTTEYTWMEKQQAKLQADYDKGIQLMRGA